MQTGRIPYNSNPDFNFVESLSNNLEPSLDDIVSPNRDVSDNTDSRDQPRLNHPFFIFNRIFRNLQVDDIILLGLIALLIIEGSGVDEILIIMLLYIFIIGHHKFFT